MEDLCGVVRDIKVNQTLFHRKDEKKWGAILKQVKEDIFLAMSDAVDFSVDY